MPQIKSCKVFITTLQINERYINSLFCWEAWLQIWCPHFNSRFKYWTVKVKSKSQHTVQEINHPLHAYCLNLNYNSKINIKWTAGLQVKPARSESVKGWCQWGCQGPFGARNLFKSCRSFLAHFWTESLPQWALNSWLGFLGKQCRMKLSPSWTHETFVISWCGNRWMRTLTAWRDGTIPFVTAGDKTLRLWNYMVAAANVCYV